MKITPEISYNLAFRWLNMAKVIEHKFKQTMNHILYSPNTRKSNKVKPTGFWDLFSAGIIAIDSQNHEELQSISGLINQESGVLKHRIDAYCTAQNIREIPTIARVKAIMFLEVKFRQISHDIATDDKSKYLKTLLSKESYESVTKELTKYEKEFALSVKKEIVEESKSINLLNTEKCSPIEEKIKKLGSLKLKKSDDTRQMKVLVIHLYYYYLSRYQEFLTSCIKSTNEEQNQNKICFYEAQGKATKSDEQIEKFLNSFRNDIAERKIVNYPESIYDLVVKCEKELDQIKSEVGVNHEVYLRSSTNVIHLSTNTLFEMIEHPVTELLMAPIQGLKLGKNLFEECDVAFNEINKIEMDNVSLCGFNARRGYFESLKQHI